MQAKEALTITQSAAPQTRVELMRGVTMRRTKGGLPVVRVHYSAHPERDPEINPDWKRIERKTYSSQAAWDREQEIVDEAGGGELVFADTLITHWNKIVITDPAWRPAPHWKVLGGMDHGKTNPTSLLRCYVDFDGNIYFAGEYYQPGREVWENAPEILKMPDIDKFETCFADPSIFYATMQQSQGNTKERAKAINELYDEAGVTFLSSYDGNRSDITFASRVMQHWANPEERTPTLFIVCRNYSEKPQPGLHDWDCPNLLWEMMRTRKKKLTAQQLMHRNPTEEIIDKDNHSRDAMKYVVMSLPEPAQKPKEMIIRERLKDLDATSAMAWYPNIAADLEPPAPVGIGMRSQFTRRRVL